MSETNVRLTKGIPRDDLIAKCMHCALCLPTCPTYVLTGLERSSPRGRIRLMKAVSQGELEITDNFVDEMNFCLDCQACQTACPAGVEYGTLVESARAQIFSSGRESLLSKMLKKVFLRWFFDSGKRMRALALILRLYKSLGIQRILQNSSFLKLFSNRLHNIQPLTPTISKECSSNILSNRNLVPKRIEHRVGFLTGCIMDVAFADVNIDTVELLVHHGCEVIVPPNQGCCGSLQAHNGDFETARKFARRLVNVFSGLSVDAIVMNSAGCGAFMKEYGAILEDDPEYAAPAALVSKKVKDITEFLDDIGLRFNESSKKAFESKRVTYHDACHLVHSQKITEQPRRLIKSVPTVGYVELPEASWCCGSAGIYNIIHYDTAMQLLDRKIENVRKIKPDIIVTGNPGCLVQLQHGLNRQKLDVELLHISTFLKRVCCG